MEKESWKSEVLATVNQAQVKLCKETWKMENEGEIERDGEQRASNYMEIEIKIEKIEDSCKDSGFRKKLLNKVGTKNYRIKK